MTYALPRVTINPCSCGGRGSMWHEDSMANRAGHMCVVDREWVRYESTPARVAVVRCVMCGNTGPRIRFLEDDPRPHLEAEFIAAWRWNGIFRKERASVRP